MSKQKSADKKKKKKASQLVIRVETGERNAFVNLCDTLDTSAAREIRRFMREWVAEHAPKSDVTEPSPEPVAAEPEPAPAQPEALAEVKPAAKARRKRSAEDAA
jgi:hypothetical protein